METYTDIYNGFVEKEENNKTTNPINKIKEPPKKVDVKQQDKSQNKERETYTDIYNGYVDYTPEP